MKIGQRREILQLTLERLQATPLLLKHFLMFFQHKFFKAVLVGAVLNLTEIVGNRTEMIQGPKMILRIHFHFLLLNVT